MLAPKSPSDWTYHGYSLGHDVDDEPFRIDVVTTQLDGPPDRREHLRSLSREGGPFNWGYEGGGPHNAANAMLADALELDEAPPELVLCYCADVVSQLRSPWRLRRGAVLRYARGWFAEQGSQAMPAALRQIPPALPTWDD
ncbi:DUF6166 domain-containing protein [Actinomycetospora cinnamomea]|uniref:DUF6166 domain-containing protein n=1 Tax=Actinomycetospora cinnamomea TaxID=663609 RepID=UPI003C2B4637